MVVDRTENYELLGAAVVKRAIKDYEKGRKLIKKNSKSILGNFMIDDVKRFFYSDWFNVFAKSSGPTLFEQIQKNFDDYKKCLPFTKDEDEADG